MTLSVAIRHTLPGLTLDVAFEAAPGITAIFGRSGAGKTTLVNAVAGLLRPQEGRIALDGRVLFDAATWVPPHRRRIGYVFQDGRLFPHLTVRQNLVYGRWFAGGNGDLARMVDLLGIGGLLERRPARLSGGEKQRVAIGRALLANPALLLMDEPLAALDDARKAEILPHLERLRDEGGLPILYVSHSVAEVARLAAQVVLLEAGRVRGIGSPSQMLADPALSPALGRRQMGAVLPARVVARDADGLARLETSAGVLLLDMPAPVGTALRIRIQAQDVMLSRTRPQGLSALNILPVTIRALLPEGNQTLVQLDAGQDRILARITTRSVAALDLAVGAGCFAILKTVAIGDQSPSEGGTVNGSVGETTGEFSARSR